MEYYENQILFMKEIETAVRNGLYPIWIAYSDKLLHWAGREIAITAEDIIHEIIIKTLEAKRKYKPNICIDAYIKMSVKSEVNNLLKKEKRILSLYTEDGYRFFELQNYCMITDIYGYEVELTERCLSLLNKIEGMILLAKLEGTKSNEICVILRITKGKYYHHSRSLRIKIRKHYWNLFN